MKAPRSLKARLALSLGILLTALWAGAASLTAYVLWHEMEEVFDSSLQEAAQRLLSLAVMEILERDEDGTPQRLSDVDGHDELLTYVVRDGDGNVLLQSHSADLASFPAFTEHGFTQTATHRIYNDSVFQGTIRIFVAEPLEHRAEVRQQILLGLSLPVLVVIPLSLLAIIFAVQLSLGPIRQYEARLASRNERDFSPVPADDLPLEIKPIADTINNLLDRLRAAFEAERSFAANAAHELRTPLAGAIAQVQRLKSETEGGPARARNRDRSNAEATHPPFGTPDATRPGRRRTVAVEAKHGSARDCTAGDR